MLIRRGLITDLFELSRLWKAFALESEPALKPDLNMWRELMTGMMNYKGYFLFVAEENDKILGFIDYAIQPEPGHGIFIGVINYFYVIPESRSSNISGVLWKTLIDNAKENKITELSSICFDNKLDFWKKHGFEKQCHRIRKVI